MRIQPSVWSSAQEAYLAELCVVPSQRGQGYGRELITEAMRVAREGGADYAFVVTTEDDRLAQRLYEAAGFRRTEGEGGPFMLAYERELQAFRRCGISPPADAVAPSEGDQHLLGSGRGIGRPNPNVRRPRMAEKQSSFHSREHAPPLRPVRVRDAVDAGSNRRVAPCYEDGMTGPIDVTAQRDQLLDTHCGMAPTLLGEYDALGQVAELRKVKMAGRFDCRQLSYPSLGLGVACSTTQYQQRSKLVVVEAKLQCWPVSQKVRNQLIIRCAERGLEDTPEISESSHFKATS
jgi:hypothetical protein